MFSKETYMARRAKLKQTIGSGLLLFLGNDESGMNYADNKYHFRQASTFLYFFALPYAGLSAIIDIDNDKEIIFGDELPVSELSDKLKTIPYEILTSISPRVKRVYFRE